MDAPDDAVVDVERLAARYAGELSARAERGGVRVLVSRHAVLAMGLGDFLRALPVLTAAAKGAP